MPSLGRRMSCGAARCISGATARHEARLHLIDPNSLSNESLQHALQHLHQLQAPVVASIQSIALALVHIDDGAFLPVSWNSSL